MHWNFHPHLVQSSHREIQMSDQPIIRRRTQQLNKISDERVNNQKTQSQYQPYKDAAWGFINHWYPALFSNELPEDEVQGIQICDVPIVLRRVDGKVHALKDRCVHRGVRMSEKKTSSLRRMSGSPLATMKMLSSGTPVSMAVFACVLSILYSPCIGMKYFGLINCNISFCSSLDA